MRNRDPRATLGDFIKSVRESAKMPRQEPFADALGVSASYVSKLEAGEATPSPELLLDLVKQFGADEARAKKLLHAVNDQVNDERWHKAAVRIGVAAP